MPRKSHKSSKSNNNNGRILPGHPEDYIAIIRHGNGRTEVVTEGLENLPGWGPNNGPPTPKYEDAHRAGHDYGFNEAYPQVHRETYEDRYDYHRNGGFGMGQNARATEGMRQGGYAGYDYGYGGGYHDSRMDYGGGYDDYFGGGYGYDHHTGYGGQYGYDDYAGYGGYGDYPGGHYGHHDFTGGHYGYDSYPGYGYNDYAGGSYGYDDYMGGGYGYDNYLGGYDGYDNYYGYGGYGVYGYY